MNLNDPVWVFFALAIWVVSYCWLVRLGPETVSNTVELVLGAIPWLAFWALVATGVVQAFADGDGPKLAIACAGAAVVLRIFMQWERPWNSVQRHFACFVSVRRHVRESNKSTVVTIIVALVTAGLFMAVGAVGVWSGYQLAFVDTTSGIAWGAGFLVFVVCCFVATGHDRNYIARGDGYLALVREAANKATGEEKAKLAGTPAKVTT
jgi:hypothetical protein